MHQVSALRALPLEVRQGPVQALRSFPLIHMQCQSPKELTMTARIRRIVTSLSVLGAMLATAGASKTVW